MDGPKSLADASNRDERRRALSHPHMALLTRFVEGMRERLGPDHRIPYFDPFDGGIGAELLYLLEAPGPNAVGSGFISRNNPDETAKNFYLLNQQAGIDRTRTVTWNIVPWYVGTGTKIRAVTKADILAAEPFLHDLLGLLQNLRVVVLVGRKAAAARKVVETVAPSLAIFEIPHPSPMFVNRKPGNRALLHSRLCEIAAQLRTLPATGISAAAAVLEKP